MKKIFIKTFFTDLILMFAPTMQATVTNVFERNSNSLNNKIVCGYQGWFTTSGDENNSDRWIHWGVHAKKPNSTNLCVEMYPDLSEFDDDELFPTDMTMNGTNAFLYSGRTFKTINRHVKWMKEYGIDGIFQQRFVPILYQDGNYANHIRIVGKNLLKSCEEFGRIFAVMYDVSGASEEKFKDAILKDWKKIVDDGMTKNDRYIKHKGKPIVGIWGFGFKDGIHPPKNPNVAKNIIEWFKINAPPKYRATVLGGVPAYWRTLNRDSRTEKGWAKVYHSFDIISPWSIGRCYDKISVDRWKKEVIIPDLKETKKYNIDYLPVIYPGFSWHNLTGKKANQIPRNGGNFYWHQAYNAVDAGANMLYVAMFDEVDEATAIYKVAPKKSQTPDQGFWLTLDADGYSLPSDWYLRLTGDIGKMLRKEIPVTNKMPNNPTQAFAERSANPTIQ